MFITVINSSGRQAVSTIFYLKFLMFDFIVLQVR
jgi:hypothetical protein